MAVCFPHSWKAVHNFTTGPVARIFLGWDSAVFSVSPVFTSNQLIIVEVDLIQDKRNFLLSVVYGHNRIRDRRSLWEDMRMTCHPKVFGLPGLDRVLTNLAWLDMFPNAETFFLAPGVSDHCLISVAMVSPNGRRKPFKFFNFWLQHPDFSQILNNSWCDPVEGGPMFALSSKLRRLKSVLRQLNLKCYSNISKRVLEAKTELSTVQERLFASPTDDTLCT
ncbi:hypothetical protein RHGRI_007519 [Rhododendron griersonianum]|uniref:Endonuclease/exonuclease/phosphatase domain-containing protein n=1 Tax=Rhododendron griersonianum TaxID=479676 RepID=A0AAV6L026_9ERIC|nr:hypothetical protein RHGRI_007519 [Rhododendron griersonianum]